jgi:site-specific recombinase XerD
MGLRDRAVLLLLSRLGLRCGDVVGLTAEDVDWKHGGLRVTGKGRRPDVLPLPQEVGDALLAYIERGRSENRDRTIFLRARAPHRPLSRIAVTDIVASALRRAGIVDAPTKGAHQLRHSAATNMLRAGVGLHEIGTVLRHRSMATTAIYAKVDVASLAAIAQPWPGRS